MNINDNNANANENGKWRGEKSGQVSIATDSLPQEHQSTGKKMCIYTHTHTHTYIHTHIQKKSAMTRATSSFWDGVCSLGKL